MRRKSLLLGLVLAAGCAGGSGAKSSTPPPKWFTTPPKGVTTLFFVGDATSAPDEGTARDLAVQKALFSLSVFCGAKVKSQFESFEQEANGKYDQSVSMTVDVEGEELEVREVAIKTVVVNPSGGAFDGYAMIEWPKAQYEALQASLRAKAERALAAYKEAEQAANDNDATTATRKIREARSLLGVAAISLKHKDPDIADTKILARKLDTLAGKIEEDERVRKSQCAVAVRCVREGKETTCDGSRLGAVREAVTKSGKKVTADALNPSVVAAILTSNTPAIDAAIRNTACVIAVQFKADFMSADKPFTFIRYGARGVVFDTATKRITHNHEIPPTKMGHVSFEGAMKKGFDQAQAKLIPQLSQSISSMK